MGDDTRRLDDLALPLIASILASPGDIVRLAHGPDRRWLYGRVEERLANGDLVCSMVDAQWWPSLIVDGVLPGVRYAIRPDRVLSVVKPVT